MIGWMPDSASLSENSSAPKRLPVSVRPTAGKPCATASLASLELVMAPSSSEYAECTFRCTKPGAGAGAGAGLAELVRIGSVMANCRRSRLGLNALPGQPAPLHRCAPAICTRHYILPVVCAKG